MGEGDTMGSETRGRERRRRNQVQQWVEVRCKRGISKIKQCCAAQSVILAPRQSHSVEGRKHSVRSHHVSQVTLK